LTRRILEVLGRSAGGIARHVAQVTEALDGSDGLVVDVACPPDLPVAMPKQPKEIVIPDGVRGHAGAVLQLRRTIRGGGYALVHAHGLRAGIDCALASPRGTDVVVTVHNLVQPEVAGRRVVVDRWAEPLVVRLADRTLAVSQQISDHLKQLVPRASGKLEVLYLGVGDPPAVSRTRDEMREELAVEPGRCLAVTVARLAPQKALPLLLDALSRTSTRPILALLGEGPLEGSLRAQCARLGLTDQVRFLGFRDDVADVVAAADVFCLSSVWEGVPLSVQEAILLGTPVVSTDVGGMSEIVVDGRSGRLVASGDARALAAAIDEVCSSPDIAERFATQARAELEQRFSTSRMLERLAHIYRNGLHDI
jgi:glycosyltransferase involved in cell wall biosynthesis